MNHFSVLVTLLQDRQSFLEEIQKGVKLNHKIVSLLISSAAFFGVYGAIIGATHSWMQVISSFFKLPALYLLTLMICFPTLYIFSIIFGSQRSFTQYLTLLMTAEAIMSAILFGFAPITLFFLISTQSYEFFVLLNITILGLAGFLGIKFFYEGMKLLAEPDISGQATRTKLLQFWLLLYGFVGTQMGWTLRPFFGSVGEFQLFRDLDGNIYFKVLQMMARLLGY
ncbi:MAG: actin-binding WH2 domain-containing protein [Chroococcales cyanobacterium]